MKGSAKQSLMILSLLIPQLRSASRTNWFIFTRFIQAGDQVLAKQWQSGAVVGDSKSAPKFY
ncbi:hypothetical protein H6F90_01385 [Trichocoleus sp. FACHB-591]|uniref:hypothetical protein n=1 Tax=Trichocoleus sp. FACHB-591 TaxID=2692872 RepID=UPI001683CCCA|nr:hypothetical protein [Trichocoleus sp. FACHB-591]MBD2093806.1 hypothetical protein [Trichocoleus sp. FACHB-591]